MASGNNYTNLGLSSDLIAIAQRKASKLVKDSFFPYNDLEDLCQELLIALWQAIEAYDRSNQVVINRQAFAQNVINDKAVDLIRKSSRYKRIGDNNVSITSLHDPICENEDYLLLDTIEENTTFYEYSNASFAEQMEADIDIDIMIEMLSDDLQELYHLLQIMSITEIAKLQNKSRTTIHKKLAKLKKEISKNII